jgi:hypothetical protein
MYSPYIPPSARPADLLPSSYTVGNGSVSQGLISSYDIYKPNEFVRVFERHNYALGFRLMLDSMGFKRGCSAPTTGHYEYGWRKDLVKVGAIVTAASGAGGNIILALDAGSMFTTSATVGGVARKGSYVRENDMIVFKNGAKGFVVSKDTSTDPHRITVRPVKSTVNLNDAVAVNESYFIADNAWGEAQGLPKGRVSRVIKYNNTFQIVKEAFGETGSEATNQTYFEPVEGKTGSFSLKTELDTYYRFEEAKDAALLWGQSHDNIMGTSDFLGYDVPVEGTEGFVAFVEGNGYTDLYNPAAYTIDDFDDISRKYESERIGVRQIIALQGFEAYARVEKALQNMLNADMAALLTKDFFSPNEGVGTEFSPISDSDFALRIGFKGLQKTGYQYGFKLVHAFNEAMGAGASGYDHSSRQYFMPIGFLRDKVAGTNVPTVGYEYKMLGGKSRENIVASITGLGANMPSEVVSNEVDARRCGFLSHLAFHGTCANHVIVQKPQ